MLGTLVGIAYAGGHAQQHGYGHAHGEYDQKGISTVILPRPVPIIQRPARRPAILISDPDDPSMYSIFNKYSFANRYLH